MSRSDRPWRLLPRLAGADIELANFILGDPEVGRSSREAARLLLHAMPGVSAAPARHSDTAWNATGYWSRGSADSGSDPRDWGRKFLAENGACAYIDLDHLELALPECLSAYDHVAAWRAMLELTRTALDRVNRLMPEGRRVCVLANNSDGLGHSYGSHLNFLVSRRLFHDIFSRRIHPMLVLAAYHASSIVFTGAGKAGAENRSPNPGYQISQRADFVETLVGAQTTWCRPLVNSRDEPLCGRSPDLARLHVICCDNTLAQVGSLLKVGVLQLILAMLEEGAAGGDCILEDPVSAMRRWSRDPSLGRTARTSAGSELTAVGLQLRFLAAARKFQDDGGFVGVVPRAGEILDLWEDTLARLEIRAFDSLAGRLDWVLKLRILERARELNPGLEWSGPELKRLDHLYSSLDPDDGLFWKYEQAGLVETVVPESRISRLTCEPPENTRAWARARLLRWAAASGADVEEVTWDRVRLRSWDSGWPEGRTFDLPDPLGFTRAQVGPLFDEARDIHHLADGFEALHPLPDAATESETTIQ